MKASILTFSQTGNTRKVGAAISGALQDCKFDVDHNQLSHRSEWNPSDADLLGIGCPVFENRPAEVVPLFFQRNGFDFVGKKAFVFITSGGSPARSLWRLARVVERTGASVIGGIQIRGVATVPTLFGLFPDRPNAEDLQSAENFGRALATSVVSGEELPPQFRIDSKQGGIFYDWLGPIVKGIKKKGTPLPVVDQEKCTLCGNCVYECPTGSISIVNKTVQFKNSCIVCYRCWHVCPNNAIAMKFSPGNGLMERLIYSERMERWFGNTKSDEYVGPNLYKQALAREIKLEYDRQHPNG